MTKNLIVEDDKALRETLCYSLAHQEHTVEAVGDGLLGLEKRLRPVLT